MRQCVTLGLAAVVGYGFISSCEAYWLEAQEADRFWIIQRELYDSSYLFVVDAVDDRHYWDDFYAGVVQVLDGFQFYVEQVADHAMGIGGVADAVELQVGVAHAGFYCLLAEF